MALNRSRKLKTTTVHLSSNQNIFLDIFRLPGCINHQKEVVLEIISKGISVKQSKLDW